MKHALLFRDNQEPTIVSAEEVKEGLYDRHDEFVDPEYEFKVEYVKAAKHGGGPYFRYYYSYEEYKRLFLERADRYQIVQNMRKYDESEWHTRWKANVENFCHIEKAIHNQEAQRWKIADAYYADTRTCVEFQHSYISFHFEEKNEFYRALSLQTVWLYDLTNSNIKQRNDGSIDILENNAKGFFRISENADNLRDNLVYIQVKSGKIYRVTELERRESSQSFESTIRYFWPSEIYEEQEFITAIKSNSFTSYESILSDRKEAQKRELALQVERLQQVQEAEKQRQEQKAESIRKQQELEAEKLIQLQEAERERENAIRQAMQHANYEQIEHDVLDCNGRRWIMCKFCKKAVLFNKQEVSSYSTHRNKGICFDCRFRR